MQLIGGGGRKAQQRAQAEARQIQSVANDRQLSALAQDAARTGATRRNPRGRKLFMADAASKSTLA